MAAAPQQHEPPTFSVEYILSFKDKYVEKPYPDFSIAEICRRKTNTARLTHGEGAWVARKAVSTEEAVAKQVRSALNKLNQGNYDTILSSELRQSWLLEDTAIGVFVRLVFEKALTEPNFSGMYAKLCLDMARFEMETLASQPTPPTPPGGGSDGGAASPSSGGRKSRFREFIIKQAQREFTETEKEAQRLADIGESQNAVNEDPDSSEGTPLSRLAKRKRANIKFVGELFTIKVVSIQVMGHTMNSLLKLRQALPTGPATSINRADLPSDLDIEVVTELIETVGKHMEADETGRAFLEKVFERINSLVDLNVYAPRIHYKLMGTVEFRENGWMSRAHSRSIATPSVPREHSMPSASSTTKRATGGLPMKSPAVFTPTRGGKSAGAPPKFPFPESPAPTGSGAAASPVVPAPVSFRSALVGASSMGTASGSGGMGSGSAPGSGNHNGGSSSFMAAAASIAAGGSTTGTATSGVGSQAGSGVLAPPSVKIDKKISELLREFEADGGNTPMPNWTGRFAAYKLSDEELNATVVCELVTNACLTTVKNAQTVAASCITIGLSIPLPDVVKALGRFLTRVVEEALYEDAPRVFERLITVIREICSASRSPPPSTAAVATPTTKTMKAHEVVCMVMMSSLGTLRGNEDVEDPVSELIRLWHALPVEPLGEEAVHTVIRSRGSGSLSARLAAEMLKWITVTHPEMAPVSAVEAWTVTPQGKAAVEFTSILRDSGVTRSSSTPPAAA